MPMVVPGRKTHKHDGEIVVFLIGMTINKPWRPDRWLPVFRAMPRMLRELGRAEDSGLLGHRLTFEGRNPTLIQYWNSLEKLYDYAKVLEAEHWPAWKAFYQRAVDAEDAVGIWHETYLSSFTDTIYVNTPALGLAKVTELVPLTEANRPALP
jgi:hypothetical protein